MFVCFFTPEIFAQVPPIGPSGCVDPRGCDFPSYDTSGGSELIYVIGGTMAAIAIGGTIKILKSKKPSSGNPIQQNDSIPKQKEGHQWKKHGESSSKFDSTPKLLRTEDIKDKVPVHMPWTGIAESPPDKVEQIADLLKEKWDNFATTSTAQFFENVGNCIIDNGGALHTKDAWIKKYEEWAANEALGKTKVGMFTTYSDGVVKLKSAAEFGRMMEWYLLNEFAKDISKVPQIKILTFLVSNFGLEMSTSYICLFVNLKKL